MTDQGPPTNPPRLPHLPELEGLRGPLAWWVVVSHYLFFSGYRPSDLPEGVSLLVLGTYAVDLFILLSGLVITRLIVQGRESYPSYLWRRWLRLFPAYVVCLATVLLLGFSGISESSIRCEHPGLPHSDWRDRILYQESLVAARPIAHSLAHLTMLHGAIPENVLPEASLTILSSAWSISLEWQFYLLAPPLVWFGRRSLVGIALLVVACVAGRSVLYRIGLDYQSIGAFLPLHAEYFWMGSLSYFFLVRAGTLPPEKSALILTIGMILTITPAVHIFAGRHLFFAGEWVPLSLWAIVIASLIAPRPNLICRLLSSPIFQFLGRMSYSTYLSHEIALILCSFFVPKSIQSRSAFFLYLMLTAAPLTFLLSMILHRWVESPGVALGRRRPKGHPADGPSTESRG